MPRVLKFPDGKLTTSMRYGSLLIQIRKWCPRALYLKRRPQIYLKCTFPFPWSRNPSEVFFTDSTMAALPSSPSSIPRSTHSHLCTSDLHLPLIVFAWSRRESEMLEVRYPALCRGRSAVKSIFPSSGNPSEVSKKCLQEVQTISCATLFAPVLRVEAVQAMSAWVFMLWSCSKRDLAQ
jgi:hypothetical protein